jgi:hypothetical protein
MRKVFQEDTDKKNSSFEMKGWKKVKERREEEIE